MEAKKQDELPSVDDEAPDEQGGPTARKGFNYQDEVAVSIILEALGDHRILKIHFETHDDILLKRADSLEVFAEFIQVKSGHNKLWSVADLCKQEAEPGRSMFEKSLRRDCFKEKSLFRIVTEQKVAGDLDILGTSRHAPERTKPNGDGEVLAGKIREKCKGAKSGKGNDESYWVKNCVWECPGDLVAIENSNRVAANILAAARGIMLLPEQIDAVLRCLRSYAKNAADEKWKHNKEKKIASRERLLELWNAELDRQLSLAEVAGGGKLESKLLAIGADTALVRAAAGIRREFVGTARDSGYMPGQNLEPVMRRVKAELHSLHLRMTVGEIEEDGLPFLLRCQQVVENLESEIPAGMKDGKHFLQGCMYDVTDRCQHKFRRN